MTRVCLLLLAAWAACSSRRAEPPIDGSAPPLAALVTREETSLRADGVTQIIRFQERLFRKGDQVWIERVLRAQPRRSDRRQPPDFEVAPRWISRAPDGGLRLRLALTADRALVEVPPAEYESVGFNPSWSELTQLVGSDGLRSLRAAGKQERGAEWLEGEAPDGSLRVLWSDTLALALQAESARKDQSLSRSMRVEVLPLPAALPWEKLQGFDEKAIDAYRD